MRECAIPLIFFSFFSHFLHFFSLLSFSLFLDLLLQFSIIILLHLSMLSEVLSNSHPYLLLCVIGLQTTRSWTSMVPDRLSSPTWLWRIPFSFKSRRHLQRLHSRRVSFNSKRSYYYFRRYHHRSTLIMHSWLERRKFTSSFQFLLLSLQSLQLHLLIKQCSLQSLLPILLLSFHTIRSSNHQGCQFWHCWLWLQIYFFYFTLRLILKCKLSIIREILSWHAIYLLADELRSCIS